MSKVVLNVAFPDETDFNGEMLWDIGLNMLFNFFIATMWKDFIKIKELREWMYALYDQKYGWIREDSPIIEPAQPELLHNMFYWWCNSHFIIVNDNTKIIKEVASPVSHIYHEGQVYNPDKWGLIGGITTNEKVTEEFENMYNAIALWRELGLDELQEKYGKESARE
jgi:hypothetical protein